jgi:hypothetical protein
VTSPIWGCASSNLDEVVHLKIYQIECSRFEKYSDPKYNKHKNFTVSRFISQQYKIQQAPQNPADSLLLSLLHDYFLINLAHDITEHELLLIFHQKLSGSLDIYK